MSTVQETPTGALAGIRVLDLSRVLAGPWATQILADLGADVIKVERPGSGDDTRGWGPPWVGDADDPSQRMAAYYLCANRNKRSITIDLATPRGRELVRALATQSDVLVENFKVGGLARYGLDWPSLQEVNPRLVYCSITGFGQDGPYAHRAGYDFLVQGLGGLMSVTGRPDDEAGGGPLKVGVALTDILTGLYAANAIQAALTARRKTGRGQSIDMALLDVQVACLANQAMNYLTSGRNPQRLGNAHPNIVPYQDFPTADGHMILAVGNDGQFARFCRAAGVPELADDPRFATNAARVAHRDVLVARLSEITAGRRTAEWMDLLEAHAVPCGPVNRLDEVFADPQVQARGLRQQMTLPGVGALPQLASPMRLSETPVQYRHPPPRLGADTQDVLQELLAMTPQDAAALRSQGVV